MHQADLIFSLAACLIAALVGGYVTQRLGLSPIVGYLLAGVAVGPHTPGFEADQKLADQFAEIGVVLLLFGVGLQFHWRELLAVRRIAISGAIVQSLVATLLGIGASLAIGWNVTQGLVYGLSISVASTVVLIRILSDNHELHTPVGHIAVGWLVVEDLLTVLMLVLLPIFFGANAGQQQPALAVGLACVKLAALVAFVFLVGGRAIPWLLERVAATKSRELFTLTVLAVALGIAVGAARVFDVSMPLGAFLAGMVVGRSEFSLRAASDAMPMRDAFAVLFFVSVGMLVDPAAVRAAPGLFAATLAIILVGKPLAAFAIVKLMGYPLRTALAIAVALAQIGEFSFILSGLAEDLKLMPELAQDILVVASLISITLNPLLFRSVSWLERKLASRANGSAAPPKGTAEDAPALARHRAIIVGHGPVGRALTRLFREHRIEPVVVEMNLDTVRELKSTGLKAIYGDATHPDTITAADPAAALALVLSTADMAGAKEAIRHARSLNPKIRVIARTGALREAHALREAGADAVFSGEGEVALTMAEFLLRKLGATSEQVERERERLRHELHGGSVKNDLTILQRRRAATEPANVEAKPSEGQSATSAPAAAEEKQ